MKMVVFLFLTQEKKQKNMHLKRIAKSSLRSGKKNNSSPAFDIVKMNAGSLNRFFFFSSNLFRFSAQFF